MQVSEPILRTESPLRCTERLRTQLTILNEREVALLQELREIRVASQVLQAELDVSLARCKGSFVQTLPNEILVTIFEYATSYHCATCVEPCWKWLGVCRRWKNVISHTPSLWTHINVTPRWSQMMVKRHLIQSRDLPLDITIRPLTMRERWYGLTVARRHLLSLIAPLTDHAWRWRSLDIRGFPPSTLQLMLAQFDNITYSRVERIHIQSDQHESGASLWPNWVSTDFCPQLKHLHLGAFRIPDVVPSFDLASLTLITDNTQWTPAMPALPFALRGVLLSSANLANLTLYGTGRSFRNLNLVPDSIHIPTLHTLKLYPRDIEQPGLECLMMAIVAPELRHLEFVPRWPTDTLTPSMFYGITGSKFPHVTHVRVKNAVNVRHNMASLAIAFRTVRHAALGEAEVTALLAHNGSHRPIEHWNDLESLTIIEPEMAVMENIFKWLADRDGKAILRISLEAPASCTEFLELCERLMRYAIVELKGVEVKIGTCTFPINPSLRVVCSPV